MPASFTRRSFFGASAAALGAQVRSPEKRPNIVILLADDLGWGDVSMNGCPDIRTPFIDSLARDGARLTQFYANAPECSPTRCALLTGRYQHRVGGLECAIGVNNIGRYDEAAWLQRRGELGLPASEISMAQIFRKAGYDTALFGKWHLGYDPKHWPGPHGFAHYLTILGGSADYFAHTELNEGQGKSHMIEDGKAVNPKGYLTDVLTERAIAWLKKRSDKPWLLYLPYNAPHVSIQDPDEYNPATGTAPYRDRHRPTFCRMVERLDKNIGSVLEQISLMPKADNTIVIFMSDNGGDPNGRNLPYRGNKTMVYEGGIRVPCAIRWPERIEDGITSRQVALSMDILPTLLSAAGLTPPSDRKLDGIDLLPHLQPGARTQQRTVFWRYKRADVRRKAVRHGDWKYINDSGRESLFNLGADERETKDLLSGQSAIAQDLKDKLAAWEEEVRAPRLQNFHPESA